MFFLLRMAFWLALILLILPIGVTSDGGRQIGAWQAFTAVQAAINDARGFCQRQPDACAVGGEMLDHMAEKAQASAKWVYDAIGAHKADAGTAPAAPQPSAAKEGSVSHDLTPQDLAPAWSLEPQRGAPAPGMPLPPRRPA